MKSTSPDKNAGETEAMDLGTLHSHSEEESSRQANTESLKAELLAAISIAFSAAAEKASAKASRKMRQKRRVTENDLTVTLLDALEDELDEQVITTSSGGAQLSFACHKLQPNEENTAGGDFLGIMRLEAGGEVLVQKAVLVQAKMDREKDSRSRVRVNGNDLHFPRSVVEAIKVQDDDMRGFVSEPYVLVVHDQGCHVAESKSVTAASATTAVPAIALSAWMELFGLCPVGDSVDDAWLQTIREYARLKKLQEFVLEAVVLTP